MELEEMPSDGEPQTGAAFPTPTLVGSADENGARTVCRPFVAIASWLITTRR